MNSQGLRFLAAVAAVSFVGGALFGWIDLQDNRFGAGEGDAQAASAETAQHDQAEKPGASEAAADKEAHAGSGGEEVKSGKAVASHLAGGNAQASADNTASRFASGCLANPVAIEDMQKQKERIAAKEKELAAKETELKALEKAVTDEMAKLDEARKSIAKVDNLRKEENQEKLNKLVETLEGMKPKTAAAMIASLDEALAVTAMSQLSTQKLSKIMNEMEPAKGIHLAEILAGVSRARTLPQKGVASNGAAGTQVVSVKGGERYDGQSVNSNNGKIDDGERSKKERTFGGETDGGTLRQPAAVKSEGK